MLTRTYALIVLLGATLQAVSSLPASAIQAAPPSASTASAAKPSPAEQRIASAKRQLAADSKHTQAYTDLALATIRRARETDDPAWLAQADATIAAGLRIAPGDFQLLKAHVALLLARKDWKPALDEATALNGKNPDDVTVYGYVAQADIALGKIDDADKAAQWMLNMRPNNIPGLLLGADLRVIYKDAPGALDFLGQAFAETPQIEPEEQAWIANRMAEVELGSGQIAGAAKALAKAEELYPQSPHWQATRAQLEAARHTPAAAPAAPAAQSAEALAPPVATPAPTATAPLVLRHDPGNIPTALLIPKPTSTDHTIKKMQSLVAARPQDPATYAGLGAAFFQRARETGDVEDYNLAEQAIQKSLDLVSTDLAATAPLATMAEVCMGEHRFKDALAYAQQALALGSGDLSPFAIVGDAYADMGEYEKAGIAYSRLQPTGADAGAHGAYSQQTRSAYLRFIAGDTDAAIAEMQSAIGIALESRLPGENLAWLYYELGEFHYLAGHIDQAADAYYTALTVYPGNYRALAGLGKVRAAQDRLNDAITLYQAAIAVVPMPLYIAELGDIYAKAGKPADAEKQYKLVEYIGRLGHINQVLHNRDLALFYADHDRNLLESLALARKEFEVRSDIYTWDALAWALYKNGKYPEAAVAMDHARRLGARDPILLFHAGMIAAKLGKGADAARLLNEAVAINPHFSVLYASQATLALDALHHQAEVATDAGSVAHAKGDSTQR